MNQILSSLSYWSKRDEGSKTPLGPVMVDIEGYELTEHEKQRLKHPLVGSVILFTRNFQSREQLTRLCQEIHSLRDTPLLIVVDHEGGRVQRFKTDGFTHLPAMRELGRVYEQDELLALQLAQATGFILASELRACGVDFSFTPVLDLDYGRSDVIGNRAFHADPKVVSLLSRALIQGLSDSGMASCGKHFPGHGYVNADSHTHVPIDDRSFEEIYEKDVKPYIALGNLSLPAIMPAHVIYEKVDSQPAGFSKFWVQKILREQLAYQGVIFSDDLTMEGASVAGDIHDRAKAAFHAGCDMVLVCNRPDLADELLEKLTPPADVELKTNRLMSLLPVGAALTWDELQTNGLYVNAKRLLHQNISQ
ncbi:beta-N-acetylhexosaminidase [Basilea psittacipulmonis]|uniref:beta-N-acetylhexosaminidase n=1 Tax=Basilea psittacipulmonis TaxID=1472345 RepID=UPI0009868620